MRRASPVCERPSRRRTRRAYRAMSRMASSSSSRSCAAISLRIRRAGRDDANGRTAQRAGHDTGPAADRAGQPVAAGAARQPGGRRVGGLRRAPGGGAGAGGRSGSAGSGGGQPAAAPTARRRPALPLPPPFSAPDTFNFEGFTAPWSFFTVSRNSRCGRGTCAPCAWPAPGAGTKRGSMARTVAYDIAGHVPPPNGGAARRVGRGRSKLRRKGETG